MHESLKKTMKVYIVDDDALSNTVMGDFLQKKFGQKMSITPFETGESCLGAIASEVPDLVILDYFLDTKAQGAANGIVILKRINATIFAQFSRFIKMLNSFKLPPKHFPPSLPSPCR